MVKYLFIFFLLFFGIYYYMVKLKEIIDNYLTENEEKLMGSANEHWINVNSGNYVY